MTVRRIILLEDYPVIRTWWERRNGEPPPIELLPDVGVMVEEGNTPLACAFLYEVMGGNIAMIEWEATNPVIGSALRAMRALHMVFDFFENYCRERSIPVVLSWVAEGRGDGRLLEQRKWRKCPGERHAMMAFITNPKEAPCLLPC